MGIHSKHSTFNLFPGLDFVVNSDDIKNVNATVILTDGRQRSDWAFRFFLIGDYSLYLLQEGEKIIYFNQALEMPWKTQIL